MTIEHAIVIAATGVCVGLLGVAIKYFGMVELIAGYDPDRVADDEGLADFVGTNALYVAALTVLVGLFEYAEPLDASGIHWIVFVVAVFAVAARMIAGARRYEHPSGDSPRR